MGSRRNSRGGHAKGLSHKAPIQEDKASDPIATPAHRQSQASQPETKASENQPENRYERRIANWTVVVGAFTVVLAIATAISGYVLWQTDHTLKETLGVQTASSERQLRAYLIVDHESLRSSPSKIETDILVRHAGVTAAYDVWLAASIKVARYPRRADEAFDNVWSAERTEKVKWGSIFGTEPKRKNISFPVSLEAIKSMRREGQRFYLAGSVCYFDIFEKRRQYDFCFSFDPEQGVEKTEEACEGHKQPNCPLPGWGH